MTVKASTRLVGETISEAKKTERPKRRFRVEINEKLCKGCYICVRYCPMGVFAESKEIGELGYNLAKVAFPEKCTGCKLCLLYCPDLATAVDEEEGGKK